MGDVSQVLNYSSSLVSNLCLAYDEVVKHNSWTKSAARVHGLKDKVAAIIKKSTNSLDPRADIQALHEIFDILANFLQNGKVEGYRRASGFGKCAAVIQG